jgi:transcriptional regulator with XRE-family HTH domain
MKTVNQTIEHMAAALTEARLDLDLSQRDLALLSGVSAATIRKLEHGGRVHPALIVRIATALTVFELHSRVSSPGEWMYVPEPDLDTALAEVSHQVGSADRLVVHDG